MSQAFLSSQMRRIEREYVHVARDERGEGGERRDRAGAEILHEREKARREAVDEAGRARLAHSLIRHANKVENTVANLSRTTILVNVLER